MRNPYDIFTTDELRAAFTLVMSASDGDDRGAWLERRRELQSALNRTALL
jgi:hypothetical protein